MSYESRVYRTRCNDFKLNKFRFNRYRYKFVKQLSIVDEWNRLCSYEIIANITDNPKKLDKFMGGEDNW